MWGAEDLLWALDSGGVSMRTLAAWFLLCSMCLGGTRDPSVPDGRHLDYGEGYPFVIPLVSVCGCGVGPPHESRASAVAIAPRWVLTAAHVVKGKSSCRVLVRGKEFPIRVVLDGRFRDGDLERWDIALGETGGDMGLDFYPPLYEGSDEAGKLAGICGYGVPGTFSAGVSKADGRRRAGSNYVDSVRNHSLICSASLSGRTSLEYLISAGDSGGGLFIDGRLAGVNSFVKRPDGSRGFGWGHHSGHTRVSLFVPWIREVTGVSP